MNESTRGRDLAVLFGDAAGAAVIGATEVNDPRRDPHIFSTHIHMDEHNCLEVVILRGTARKIQEVAGRLLSAKGVKHGKLITTTTGQHID